MYVYYNTIHHKPSINVSSKRKKQTQQLFTKGQVLYGISIFDSLFPMTEKDVMNNLWNEFFIAESIGDITLPFATIICQK